MTLCIPRMGPGGEKGPVPPFTLAVLTTKFALEPPEGRWAEPCIYVHTQCLTHAPPSRLHRTGWGRRRPCQSGPDLAPLCSTPPCPATWSRCHTPALPRNPGDQGAESRSWVCLILLIGFNFSFALFSSDPCGSPGAENKDRFMQLFSYIPCSEWVGASLPFPSRPSLTLAG